MSTVRETRVPPTTGPVAYDGAVDTDGGEILHLLLVEDDDGDALLVEELLLDAGLTADVTRAWSLEAALDALGDPVDCVLLDLGLPDATGLDALVQLRLVSDAALVVLTGLDGIDRGVEAVAAGAQDYLVKGRVDGETLGRAVRYAIERRRGQHARSDRRGAAGRAERITSTIHGLRPAPQRPAGVHALARADATDTPLSTKLWDVVERGDGTSLVIFGAVRGDGPTAATQAAALAVSFRALALAGLGVRATLETLDAVARPGETLADATVLELDPGTGRVTVLEAGDSGPLRFDRTTAGPLGGAVPEAPLGTGRSRGEAREIILAPEERLLFVATAASAGDRIRQATRAELLDLLAASGSSGVRDDDVCDAVTRALHTLGAAAPGHVALLGWTSA